MIRCLLIAMAWLCLSLPAQASLCAPKPPLPDALTRASGQFSIFIGTVESLDDYLEKGSQPEFNVSRKEASLHVVEPINSTNQPDLPRVALTHKPDGLRIGMTYLFFIGTHDDAYYQTRENEPRHFVFWAGGCNPDVGTMPVAEAAAQIEWLRGRKPERP